MSKASRQSKPGRTPWSPTPAGFSSFWLTCRGLMTLTAAVVVVLATLTASPASALDSPSDTLDEEVELALENVESELSAENDDVHLPVTATEPAVLETEVGSLEIEFPASATGEALDDEYSQVFVEDDGTSVVIQSTETGLRALIHIPDESAPERYEFELGGDVVELVETVDGGVVALDAEGEFVAVAPAPWAVDANGQKVPTHFEIDGTTLFQVVKHQGAGFEYGIVADPWWNPLSWPWGKWVKVAKKTLGSALTKCGAGALKGALGLGIATGTTNVMIEKYSSTLSKVKVGGVYGYVGAAVAGCIINNL